MFVLEKKSYLYEIKELENDNDDGSPGEKVQVPDVEKSVGPLTSNTEMRFTEEMIDNLNVSFTNIFDL